MTRVRVVSLRHFDPVIRKLSHRAFRAWALSLEWSCFHGSDGALSAEDVKTVGATPAVTQELLDRGVWQRDESGELFLAERRHGPVVAEVEGCDVEHLEPARKTSAERTRRYRARKNNTSPVTVTERHGDGEKGVTVTASRRHAAGLSLSGSGSSPDPEPSSSVLASGSELLGSARDSEKQAKPVSKQQGKIRMPEDFPTESVRLELLKYGRKKGLRDGQTEEQIESMQIWARSSGALKLDWFATCQGFIRSYASDERRPPGAVQHEKTRVEEARRPYHELFKPEPAEPKASPAEALEAIAGAAKAIGRRIA